MVAGDQQPIRERKTSPAGVVSVALVIATAITVAMIAWAQRLPALDVTLELAGDHVVVGGAEVTALRAGGLQTDIKPIDLIDEPDVIGSWDELDAFYARQHAIWTILQAPRAELQIAAVWRPVEVRHRGLAELPVAFYTLLAAALVAWIVGFLTYAFSDRGSAP